MNPCIRAAGWLVFALLLVPAFASRAQGSQGTIQKIKETGTISVGYRESSMPFSYLDDRQQPIGYAIDICKHVIEALKAEYNLPNLKTSLVPVTSSTRIPLLANGTIDLECGSTTNNADRQKQIAFGHSYFLTKSTFVARKSSRLSTLDDLKGKTVVSTAGSTNIVQLNKANAEKGLGINVIAANDHAEAFLTMETGRAAAFVMDDVIIASFVASSKDPSAFAVGTHAFSLPEPYGFMLRRNDPEFRAFVDKTTARFYATAGPALYSKWFESPIPPNGINLALPMSPQLKRAFARPSDSPDPTSY